jgi:hypothetical protein
MPPVPARARDEYSRIACVGGHYALAVARHRRDTPSDASDANASVRTSTSVAASDRWRPRIRRWRWRLHHRWPRLFPDRESRRAILEYHNADRDAAENAEAAVPEGQQVRVEALWLAEVFPPSLIGKLYADLARMGWDTDPDRGGRGAISDVVRQHRRDGGGWVNTGLILRPGDTRFLGGHRRAELPGEVDRVEASVLTPYPSMSIVVIKFVLRETTARRIDEALHADYRTETKPVGAGLSILTPAVRKEREANQAREEIRQVCRRWMRRNLHGRFGSAAGGSGHPVLELLSTSKGIVVGDDAAGPWSLSRLLWAKWKLECWTTRRGPTIRLKRDGTFSHGDVNTLLLNVNRHRMGAEAKRRGYGTTDNLLAHRLAIMWRWGKGAIGYSCAPDGC